MKPKAALFVCCASLWMSSSVLANQTRAAKRTPEAPYRVPYQQGKVYRVKLVPGAPFLLELPPGETVRNIWDEPKWFTGESVPGSPVVIIRAKDAEDTPGRASFVHIETEETRLRISLRVEALEQDTWPLPPAGMEIYLAEDNKSAVARQQAEAKVAKDLPYMQKFAGEKAKSDFAQWRRQLLANIRDDYEWGGDFRVDRVVDDRVQTFITVKSATDKAIIQFVAKGGAVESVNFELENGMYVIQDKVLSPGEKFRLTIGKQQAWVALK